MPACEFRSRSIADTDARRLGRADAVGSVGLVGNRPTNANKAERDANTDAMQAVARPCFLDSSCLVHGRYFLVLIGLSSTKTGQNPWGFALSVPS